MGGLKAEEVSRAAVALTTIMSRDARIQQHYMLSDPKVHLAGVGGVGYQQSGIFKQILGLKGQADRGAA